MSYSLKSMREKNYYEVLEITPNSSSEEIYQAYLKAKNAYAPESAALYSLMSREECAEMREQVEEAYSVLGDSEKKKQYDHHRGIILSGPLSQITEKKENEKKKEKEELAVLAISLKVASQKFSLQYQEDPDFEEKILQTKDFTGEFLKKIREYKNVDIERMSAMTKISKTYLCFVEEERLEKLPALAYVRGFVYQYARYLKLDPDKVANSYIQRLKNYELQGQEKRKFL